MGNKHAATGIGQLTKEEAKYRRAPAKELVCEECGDKFIHRKPGRPKYCLECRGKRF